ncbi:Gfo/Idh/MocA family oxidoreductase [Nonomuraea sp. FMUSA5-5]|uniref:Gfo/Idh/MocA family oxidoreductase n=1 Tax=Nonomuraea composti TaxID=2720023 RepID=A0ABX1AZD6_9ACTN|nr:Gfo/Idh/MocA family oxidoreductase [Nonomuraea sp. FMUSA5-5]NJP90970.1 Gfo/Idh/MocA family oxidoreductase [Nonomuraea sp. FMUSA5-5]
MTIRTGVVGASGWARNAHLPALAALPEYEITAVATTRQESADRVAAEYGVPLAFADPGLLIAHDQVDLVVVSVRAPEHAKLIRAALEAGRHVLSEWPLTVDHAEAAELAELAASAGVVHAVCLQGCHSPDVRFVADLVAGGRIGRLESAIMVASGAVLGGATIPAELAWSTDPAGGTNVLTIMAGHFLAVLERLAGRLVEVTARLPRLYDEVTVAGTGRTIPNRVPGQVLLHGLLDGGATASVAVYGGSQGPDGFFVKLAGSEGTLTITNPRPGAFPHWTDWDIRAGDGERLTVPDAYRTVPLDPAAGPAANVAALYRHLAGAIAEGRPADPDFHAAARHHRLLAAIERSAASGGPERTSVAATG